MARLRHTLTLAILLAACHQDPPPEYKERAHKGPYVSHTTQISPTESVSTLTIPSEFGPILDRHCWIYRNHEFKMANMACEGQDYSTGD